MVYSDCEAFGFEIEGVFLGERDEGKDFAPSCAVVALGFIKCSAAVRDDMLFAIGEHLGEDASNGVTTSIGVKDEGCGVWREIGIRQDRCTGEGCLEVVESSISFLGPLEFAAFLRQSG